MHCLTTLHLWGMIVDYFGEKILFLFASPVLRVLLSPYITEDNDGWFMVWVCVDSLFPFIVFPWTFQMTSQVVAWPSIVSSILICAIFLIFGVKYDGYKSLELVISFGLNVLLYEQNFFEVDYAMIMFRDITWGNREVRSDKHLAKLNIECHTGPHEKSWAGVGSQKYHKTFLSLLLTISPFIFRAILLCSSIWSLRRKISLFQQFLLCNFDECDCHVRNNRRTKV